MLELLLFPSVASTLVGLHVCRRKPAAVRAGLAALFLLIVAAYGQPTAERIGRNLERLPEWDYLGFWLHGRTAALGLDVYDPANARALAAPFDVGTPFRQEIVDAGFWYPPPSLFLFLPLGAFADPVSALPWWYALNLLAALVAIDLARRRFFPDGAAVEWLGCAALVATLHGSYETFRFSQTTFLALVVLLCVWRRPTRAGGAAWIPIAALVKPFLAAAALPALLAGRRRALAAMALVTAVLAGAAAVAFGPASYARYLGRDQLGGKPAWVYSEPTNQSLLGLRLRATGAECRGAGCVRDPLYLALSAALAAATLAVTLRLRRHEEHQDWSAALWLLLALVCYPVSQSFYSVVLLPVALTLWSRRAALPGGPWSVAFVLAAAWTLAALDGGATTLAAFLLLWTAMAAGGLVLPRGPAELRGAGTPPARAPGV